MTRQEAIESLVTAAVGTLWGDERFNRLSQDNLMAAAREVVATIVAVIEVDPVISAGLVSLNRAVDHGNLNDMPLGFWTGANRYDTDDQHVLSVWINGYTFDVRWPKQAPTMGRQLNQHRRDTPFTERLKKRVAEDASLLQRIESDPAVEVSPTTDSTERHDRFRLCAEDCTTDCGACKGAGRGDGVGNDQPQDEPMDGDVWFADFTNKHGSVLTARVLYYVARPASGDCRWFFYGYHEPCYDVKLLALLVRDGQPVRGGRSV